MQHTFSPFHAFFYITDKEASVRFYNQILSCPIKHSNATSFTIDFFGHGISFEYHKNFAGLPQLMTCNKTDIDDRQYVPSMHWGINLNSKEQFQAIAKKLEISASEFIVPPTIYNVGGEKEQMLLFVKDPTGYIIEFRYMAKPFKLAELDKWDQRSEGHERKYI
jgi:hypothetical protein